MPEDFFDSRHELELWVGHKLATLSAVIADAYALHQQSAEHVVISPGAEGALWVHASEAWMAKPAACKVVSTVRWCRGYDGGRFDLSSAEGTFL